MACTAQDYTEKPHPAGYVCLRAASPPPIDGRVQGGAWDAAPWTAEFVDIEGPTKPKPYLRTRVKMVWDDQAFYVGAWMDEPQPWASLTLHDDVVYKDNDFEVFIDPDGDNHQYYEFEINALNTLWDLFLIKPYRDGGPPLMSWESIQPAEATQQQGPTGWSPVRRAVHVEGALNNPDVHSTGWGVTIAFPWSLLKQAAHRPCPPSPGDQWRVNFSRVQWKVRWDSDAAQYVKDPPDQAEHNWVWSPQWVIAMHQPETWGYVQFSGDVASDDTPPALAAEHGGGFPAGFQPDATWPLRCFLMEVYYRQKVLWDKQHRYASSLEELGLEPPEPLRHHHTRLRVQSTEVSFIATGQMLVEEAGSSSAVLHRLYVNDEGRITVTKPATSDVKA